MRRKIPNEQSVFFSAINKIFEQTHSDVKLFRGLVVPFSVATKLCIEGTKRSFNEMSANIRYYKNKSWEKTLALLQVVEKLSQNRMKEIKQGAPYKTKNKKFIQRDGKFIV